MQQAQRRDEIDRVVDDLIAEPDRANELLAKLLERREEIETAQQKRARLRLLTLCNDAEGLWDNVPV